MIYPNCASFWWSAPPTCRWGHGGGAESGRRGTCSCAAWMKNGSSVWMLVAPHHFDPRFWIFLLALSWVISGSSLLCCFSLDGRSAWKWEGFFSREGTVVFQLWRLPKFLVSRYWSIDDDAEDVSQLTKLLYILSWFSFDSSDQMPTATHPYWYVIHTGRLNGRLSPRSANMSCTGRKVDSNCRSNISSPETSWAVNRISD